MTDVTQNLASVSGRIATACAACGRDPADVAILAVSKKHPAAAIRQAHAAGQFRFGENFVQEALEKQRRLDDLDLEWHFIGHIQSNKTAEIAASFDWVHSVDRLRIANRLDRQRDARLAPLNVCLQVRLADEPGKSGLPPDQLESVAAQIAQLGRIRFRGLMCIPPPETDSGRQHGWFAQLREAYDRLRSQGHDIDTLSMGMSDDLEAAICEGATMVRLGTAIFGPRAPG